LWRVNVLGTLNLLRALSDRRSPALRILNVGSAAEYLPHRGRTLRETAPAGGLSPYGRSKWAQGQLALALGRELGLAIVVARTFNLVGPGLSTALVAGALCAQFAQRESRRIQVGNLESQRDFIDIRDAAAAYATLVERGRPGRIYNVCTGRATRIRAVVQCLSRLTGLRPRLQRDPARLKPQDVDRVCGDNSALRSLGWKPKVSLRQSLQDMLDAAQSR
jgi:GDP-4-dehydro-6-deoxy-D-mannose reductase